MRLLVAGVGLLLLLLTSVPAFAAPLGQDRPEGNPLPPQADQSSRDIIPIVPLTAGAAAGAAAIALTFTLLRIKAGWEPHRPPAGSVADNLGHHQDDHSVSE
ncbi:MAG TPA: hypothetical protein VFB90_08570, partial [Dehalococcoidia bacterium]|nr:hypothetical protein [Dehalococcoidia bacterium]